MEYRAFGRTGIRVSPLCLGCMMFGRRTEPAESYTIIDRALDAGLNFVDTANVYARGKSEEITGQALRRDNRRQHVILATKVHGLMADDDPNASGNSAYDVDALLDLFTEEDAGPTVTADRSAWQKFEIRLWAQRQVQAGLRMEAYDYRVTEHGAAWRADVYRDDWSALGLSPLAVTNSIWLHHGRLADFTSRLTEPGDLPRLGRLWQPSVVPERPTKTSQRSVWKP